MRRTTSLTMAVPLIALLAACAPAGTTDPSSGGGPGPTKEQSGAEVPCVVGAWNLDVADYSAQAEAYVLGLGIPITGFAMTGSGVIRFTQDSLVATEIDLVTTGTIVAGDTMVPLNTPSVYNGSGDWNASDGSETINLENWANVRTDGSAPDASAPDIPAIDYTDVDSVSAVCSADTLTLQAPGAPLSSTWHR
ncbi:MAG: hypothetical protein ABIW32_07450 [Terrimesophilobacter sp.]